MCGERICFYQDRETFMTEYFHEMTLCGRTFAYSFKYPGSNVGWVATYPA